MSSAQHTSRGYELGTQGAHNISKGGKHPHSLPIINDPHEKRKWILEHMAGVLRVFGRQGFSEGEAGHVSVRDCIDENTFWMNPLGVHFSMVCAADLVHVDLNGNILPDGNQVPINAAGFAIHSSLLKARPDINAACHNHAIHAKAYSAFGRPLDMINQDACMFYNNHAVYDDFGGVALEDDEGKAIAKASGTSRVVIMQNHGLLTMGSTVDEAAYFFMAFENCCKVQLMVDAAEAGGKKKVIIGDEEARYTAFMTQDPETIYTSFQPDYNLELKLNNDFLFKS